LRIYTVGEPEPGELELSLLEGARQDILMKKPDPPRRLPHGILLLYEDRDLLVIDKPAGLLSLAGGTERDRTAYGILAEYLRKRGEKRRPAAVHRLDRDTSGVMVFAKSEMVKKKLMGNWDEAVAERRYVALAEGEFTEKDGQSSSPQNTGGQIAGVIDAPLGEDAGGRVVVRKDGKSAVTRWKLLKTGRGYSLLELELETGRRNQIRAHLSFLGHPVAGDMKYRSRTNPAKRLCLHAETISFHHPHDNRIMEFTSPAPGNFKSVF
jgi:23S rRNA pseudouridine1911/1915/1917 synthase